jgi:hypothetical protein
MVVLAMTTEGSATGADGEPGPLGVKAQVPGATHVGVVRFPTRAPPAPP